MRLFSVRKRHGAILFEAEGERHFDALKQWLHSESVEPLRVREQAVWIPRSAELPETVLVHDHSKNTDPVAYTIRQFERFEVQSPDGNYFSAEAATPTHALQKVIDEYFEGEPPDDFPATGTPTYYANGIWEVRDENRYAYLYKLA